MSNTLPIHLKSTGELFDVPYRLKTTIDDLITYVCTRTTVLSSANPSDYYLSIDNNEMLDSDRTVDETHLHQPKRFACLQICMKTHVLVKKISHARAQFWRTANAQVSKEARTNDDSKQRTNADIRLIKGETFCDHHSYSEPIFWAHMGPICGVGIAKARVIEILLFSLDRSSSPIKPSSKLSENASSRLSANECDAIDHEVHFLVCGGPKVGKSTLINALCACPVAKVNNSLGLDQCTRAATCYKMDNIYFWDTPGIQEWSQLDIDSYVNSSALRQTPVCMFYCASPNSYANLKQLDRLLDECIRRRSIFCVLVVTNMFAHVNRRAVLDEFKVLLAKYIDPSRNVREEQGIYYYGEVGLCTMVNSQEYTSDDSSRPQPQQGVNELILALTKSLVGEQLDGWLRTVHKNQKFWLDKQQELCRLAQSNECSQSMTHELLQ